MKAKKKICVVTGSRAEYGLLRWLMHDIADDPALELQIAVTGMHLSPEFGSTYKKIEEDGFVIDEKIDMLVSGDTAASTVKSMGLAMIGFADAYARLAPDVVVVMGDRFEIFAAVAAAVTARIPVAHLNGGETTEGAVDEAYRHAITKMATLHFTAMETYSRRVIQMGEAPERVFTVGEAGLDNMLRLDLLDQATFEQSIGMPLGDKSLLVTFHPVTFEDDTAEAQFKQLLAALDELADYRVILTKANADAGGRIINRMIDEYAKARPNRVAAFTSLGQLRYLSAMKYVTALVGNTSSGLVEAPSFKKPVINIGDRQKGRVRAANVIDCPPEKEAIVSCVHAIDDPDFRRKLDAVVNPYGDGTASRRIRDILRDIDARSCLKKAFHDLPGGVS